MSVKTLIKSSITFSFLFISQVKSTTFTPLEIKEQIKKSEGILVGVVESMKAIEVDYKSDIRGNRIFTEAHLKLEKWVMKGLSGSFVKVYYPGGKLGDHVYRVEGAPNLREGQKVVLFTKKAKGKVFVNNLGLGTFHIENFGKKEIMVNQVYPNLPGVGQMEMDQFYALAKGIRKERFRERFKNKYEISTLNSAKQVRTLSKRYRKIASTHELVHFDDKKNGELKERTQHKGLSHLWLLFILAFIGSFVTFMRKKLSS